MMGGGFEEGAESPPQYNEILKYMHFDWIKHILSSRKMPNETKEKDLRTTVTSFVT